MAVQIVGGAVERIDNPFVGTIRIAVAAAFFGGDFVLGIGFEQGFNQDVFRHAVDVGNKIVKRFAVGFDVAQVFGGADHEVARLARGFEGSV